jgi:GR25 family glycosyltransferase involved in LPS biosynthesis
MTLPLFEHTIFINLESREDRRTEVIQELQNWGIPNPIRFNAIKMPDGAIGCTMSHIKCLELAKERDYPQVFICEDDIHCVDIPNMLSRMEEFYKEYGTTDSWDVLLVAGNNSHPYNIIKNGIIQVKNCMTTTGYIVQRHYYDKLIKSFRGGLKNLLKQPDVRYMYAIDVYWKNLQMVDKWLALTPFTVSQRPSYSDIEKMVVDYSCYMLNYDK